MGDLLQMAIACAMDCCAQAQGSQLDAVIVGTCMGNCEQTEIFAEKLLLPADRRTPPTAFVLSTHNTIAGQISLRLGNQGYNMTHTQTSLSFEYALIDALLCIENDGCNQVLVGAAEEWEDPLSQLKTDGAPPTQGASFFILSAAPADNKTAKIESVETFFPVDDFVAIIQHFLQANQCQNTDIDLVLYASNTPENAAKLTSVFGNSKTLNYQSFSGSYPTNAAFALHYAADWLAQQKIPHRVLICNNVFKDNMGLVLLEKQ